MNLFPTFKSHGGCKIGQNQITQKKRITNIYKIKNNQSNLQHKVFTKNMPDAMQCRCHSICIPQFSKEMTPLSDKKQLMIILQHIRPKLTYNSSLVLTSQAPIQKPYQSLGHPSFSKTHSPMWERFPPAGTEIDNLVSMHFESTVCSNVKLSA